jgi:hypothetical protein
VLEGELKSVYPENDKPFRSWTKRVSSVGNPEKYDRVVGSLNYDLLVKRDIYKKIKPLPVCLMKPNKKNSSAKPFAYNFFSRFSAPWCPRLAAASRSLTASSWFLSFKCKHAR